MAENKDLENENKAVKEDPDAHQNVAGESANEGQAPSQDAHPPEPSPEERLSQMENEQLYLRAEIENIKRQSIKERSQLLKYGAERLARDLLDTLDVFQSALNSEVNADNYREFVKGVEMTAQSLTNTLEKHGIVAIPCVGQPFDPNTQEALSSEPSDEHPEGYVTQVFKAPYKYHEKLLRAGQVVVSRKKSE